MCSPLSATTAKRASSPEPSPTKTSMICWCQRPTERAQEPSQAPVGPAFSRFISVGGDAAGTALAQIAQTRFTAQRLQVFLGELDDFERQEPGAQLVNTSHGLPSGLRGTAPGPTRRTSRRRLHHPHGMTKNRLINRPQARLLSATAPWAGGGPGLRHDKSSRIRNHHDPNRARWYIGPRPPQPTS